MKVNRTKVNRTKMTGARGARPARRSPASLALSLSLTLSLSFLAAAPLSLGPAAPASAHGGGTVRAQWAGDGFHMVVETNETPNAGTFGGTVHVTLIPLPLGGDSTVRVRNLDIAVTGEGPMGERAGPVRASQALNGAYEADLTVSRGGGWTFQVAVGEGAAAQRYDFPLDVTARSWWSDLAVVGGLLAIPALGLFGLVRTARRKESAAGLPAESGVRGG